MGNIIKKVARIFDLSKDEEKLNHLSNQLDEKLLDYGVNPYANMTQYLFQGIKILEYGKNNPHSNDQLIVIQSHNYFYCEELLEEVKSAPNLKEGVSLNGFPVLTATLDGHSLVVHLGDEKIATRYTIRISKN